MNDIFIGDSYSLFASEEFIDFSTQKFSVKYLEVDPERNEFDDFLDRMIAESKEN